MSVPILDAHDFFLRGYVRDDFADFAALMSNPQVTMHTGGPMPVASIARLFESFLVCEMNGHLQAWAVVHRVRQEYLGHAAISETSHASEREMFIALFPRFWRKGSGRQIGSCLIDVTRKHNPGVKLTATVDPDHEAAVVLLERLGMRIDRWDQVAKGRYPVYAVVC